MNTLNKYLTIALSILILLFVGVCVYNSNLRSSNEKWKHNYGVLQDSIEIVSTKNGELLFENGSLILKKNELEDALNISKKQVKDYEKTLGSKLAYISKLETRLSYKDTVYIEKEKIIHDTLFNSYSIHYDDSWLKFDELFFLQDKPEIKLYNIDMNIPLKVGLTEDYTIFITSSNPYFKATSINSAVIDGGKFLKKPNRWGFNIYGGIGVQYGVIYKQIDIGPQIGLGFGFRFL